MSCFTAIRTDFLFAIANDCHLFALQCVISMALYGLLLHCIAIFATRESVELFERDLLVHLLIEGVWE